MSYLVRPTDSTPVIHHRATTAVTRPRGILLTVHRLFFKVELFRKPKQLHIHPVVESPKHAPVSLVAQAADRLPAVPVRLVGGSQFVNVQALGAFVPGIVFRRRIGAARHPVQGTFCSCTVR